VSRLYPKMDQFFSNPYSTDRRRVLPLWDRIFPRYMPTIRLIDLSHEKSRVHRVRTGSLLVAVSMVSAFYCTSNDKRDKSTYDHHVGSGPDGGFKYILQEVPPPPEGVTPRKLSLLTSSFAHRLRRPPDQAS
jgi:hypothetical protein